MQERQDSAHNAVQNAAHNAAQYSADIHLLKEAQAGNPEAFGALYERYALIIYRFLFAHLDNYLDAEDMTGEVFLRAWRSLSSYREQGLPFSAFLFRIARNVLVDRYRSNGSKAKENEWSEELEQVDESNPDPSDLIMETIEGMELRKIMENLREDYRTVLAARFISGLSPEETAHAMNKSVGAVRVLQHRALAELRKRLNGSLGAL